MQMNSRALKRAVKYLTPPAVSDTVRNFSRALRGQKPEWEYVLEGWAVEQTDSKIKGWNVEAVLQAYQLRWDAFVHELETTGPYSASPESLSARQTDLVFHNRILIYAYGLSLASRQKKSISMLDWGGGIGHYYLISKALVPDLEVDYYCKDVPLLAAHGQTLFPQAHFYSDEECLSRRYDFVLASNSLHYSRDWSSTLAKLAAASEGYLLVTMLPVAHRAPSYVFVQRPYKYGYDTEYLSWCLNRVEFLACAAQSDLELVREFITGMELPIAHAPEPCECMAFLFRRKR